MTVNIGLAKKFVCFLTMLRKKPNELFGQPNIKEQEIF